MPDLTGITKDEVQTLLNQTGLEPVFVGDGQSVTDQIPLPEMAVTQGSQVMVYLGEEITREEIPVPDFFGMTMAQAADTAAKQGLYIEPSGNPDLDGTLRVTLQEPAPDSKTKTGSCIKLTFTDTKATD